MSIDLFTITFVTAIVIVVSTVLYLLETLMRKDALAGRLWAVAFLSGTLSVLCYLVWAANPRAYLPVAFGNGGFVSSAAFMWLGARSFNGRSLRLPSVVAGAGVVCAVVAVIAAGPDGGDWAGAIAMFVPIAVFAGLGAIESRRGAIGRRWNAVGFTLVLGAECVFFVVRTIVFVVAGPDSELFRMWFDSKAASVLTIALTIVVVVVTSVLRASESNLRGQRDTYVLHVGLDGVMMPASFRSAVSTLLARARETEETVCLVSLRLDDLGRIATAFGPGEAEALAGAWRSGVRRYAPTAALVGEAGGTNLMVAFLTNSFADVRRPAVVMHRRLLDDFARLGLSVAPVVGVGVALTDRFGYDYEALADAASSAAALSVESLDASVIVAQE